MKKQINVDHGEELSSALHVRHENTAPVGCPHRTDKKKAAA
jgi:hypothetical protein